MDAPAMLRARYAGAAPEPGPQNDVIRALLSHRSVRAFRSDPLPRDLLPTLVAAAQSASTSSNLQTWSVIAVQDPARKSRLADLAAGQGFIRQAPLFLCWLADLSRLDRVGAANGKSLEGLRYLEMFMIALIDAALAAQNAVVAAESLGLGCVYVGALRNKVDEVAAELALPPDCMAVFGLSVGWPDETRPAAIKPRLPQAAILHRERYGAPEEEAAIAAYDAALKEFSRAQGMGETAWTPRVLTRVGSAAALTGRDRMTALLRGLGFGLR